MVGPSSLAAAAAAVAAALAAEPLLEASSSFFEVGYLPRLLGQSLRQRLRSPPPALGLLLSCPPRLVLTVHFSYLLLLQSCCISEKSRKSFNRHNKEFSQKLYH